MPLGRWLWLLAENRFAVDRGFRKRALATTLATAITSAFRAGERLRTGARVARVEVAPPIFVLGHWRSGTTHLHNLLALDQRFAAPRYSQVMIPETFLTGEQFFCRSAEKLLPAERAGIDKVAMRTDTPSEEEFALAQMTLLSPYLGWSFPRHADHYDRYITFRTVAASQKRRWQRAYERLLRRLAVADARPAILKSPPNTGRIQMLLDVFPDARFIHIHRDPYAVYPSTRHLHLSTSAKSFAFQAPDEPRLEQRILDNYVDMFEAFFAEREAIPNGGFTEVAFADLEARPLDVLRQIYDDLQLGDFGQVESRAKDYVDSLAGYRKNRFTDLPEPLRESIATRWRRCFDAFGYVR